MSSLRSPYPQEPGESAASPLSDLSSIDDLDTPKNFRRRKGQSGRSTNARLTPTVTKGVFEALKPIESLASEVKGALVVTGVAATVGLLYWFQAVLVPFFLAVFLMYLVDPLVNLLDLAPNYCCLRCRNPFSKGSCCCVGYRRRNPRYRGCNRPLASLLAVGIVLGFFFLVGYVTVLQVNELNIEDYKSGYAQLVQQIEAVGASMGLQINISTTLADNTNMLINTIFTDILSVLETMFVTTIYLTYFLCTRARPGDAGGVWSKIDRDIQRFVTLKAYLSLVIAIMVTLCYMWLHVGLAVVWGIVTFILNWIPNIGAMIASFLPIGIIAISPNTIMSPMDKFLAIVLPVMIHFVNGNIVEPKVFGQRLEMDPVVVILSLSAWGLIWGVVGMMLSVPLTAGFKIMLEHLRLWPMVVAILEGRFFDSDLWGSRTESYKDDMEYSSLVQDSPSIPPAKPLSHFPDVDIAHGLDLPSKYAKKGVLDPMTTNL